MGAIEAARSGPLQGLRIIEFAGIGPAPFCGMMLADMGAEVILVERPRPLSAADSAPTLLDLGRYTVTHRGKRSLALDMKRAESLEIVLRLVKSADGLIEGYRPGVMERLGLGPDVCLAHNPKLIYGRMTGWGQAGPLAMAAGHDVNYLALSGLLALGRKGTDGVPWAPPTIVGDMAGGAMFLAFGLVCALLEAKGSGRGQVVDAAITDGAALLSALVHGVNAAGLWDQDNVLAGNAHFYNVYQCKDGRWVSLGPIEPQFYSVLRDKLGLTDPAWDAHHDPSRWSELNRKLGEIFAAKSRDEWCTLLEGSDACFAPVLDLDEAPAHPHHLARETFVDIAGVKQPAPAPRFSRTPPKADRPPPLPGSDGEDLLRAMGFSDDEIEGLRGRGVI